jgi:hypothetical protein
MLPNKSLTGGGLASNNAPAINAATAPFLTIVFADSTTPIANSMVDLPENARLASARN